MLPSLAGTYISLMSYQTDIIQTPQLLIATLRKSSCVHVLLLGALSKLSFWSQSMASVTKFLVKTYV